MQKNLMEKLKRDKESPLPTPPIGMAVQWFDRDKDDMAYAAVVTAIQAPGKLELAIFKPRHHTVHKQGVMHRSAEIHQRKNNPTTVTNGSWDYITGQRAVQRHYQEHLQEIERRELAILDEERRRREARQDRKEIDREFEQEMAKDKKPETPTKTSARSAASSK